MIDFETSKLNKSGRILEYHIEKFPKGSQQPFWLLTKCRINNSFLLRLRVPIFHDFHLRLPVEQVLCRSKNASLDGLTCKCNGMCVLAVQFILSVCLIATHQ